jgi:glycosyltransferase involved in cell wall biosynthesis
MVSLVFVTNVPAVYKTSRMRALAQVEGINLSVVYANSQTYRHEYDSEDATEYKVERRSSHRIPLGGGEFMIETWSLRYFLGVDADVFVVGGWNYTAALAALIAGTIRDIPVALISANLDQGSTLSATVVPMLLSQFDAYFALSSAAREHLIDLGAQREDVTVLPNSTDVAAFRRAIDESTQATLQERYGIKNDFIILYVGLLTEDKGVNDLITAVSNINYTTPHLLIIGDGPDRDSIEKRAETLLGDGVTFTGKLPNDSLPNYYALADIFVLPTHRDTWGLVLNEAMACATPVVTTTAAGAAGDLVVDGRTGLVVPPKDSQALKRAIEHLATSPAERKAIVERAVERVEEYTPEDYAAVMVETVRTICKESK